MVPAALTTWLRPHGGLALLLALLAAACTGTGTGTNPEAASAQTAEIPRSQRCFRLSDIDSWRVIDDRQLIVRTTGGHNWYLQLFGHCSDLRFAETVGFRSVGVTQICGDPGDVILVREQRCSIRSSRPVGPAEIEELLNPAVRGNIGKDPYSKPAEDQRK